LTHFLPINQLLPPLYSVLVDNNSLQQRKEKRGRGDTTRGLVIKRK
jgi:hypothetical protein